MVDDDDDGFGDFEFAPSNPTVHSNINFVNGQDSASGDDDDDWGDFINSGGMSHAISLPNISKAVDPFGLLTDQKLENKDPEPTQTGYELSRVKSGMNLWEKPNGALPLSIFGELEKEEESAASLPPFGDGAGSLFSSRKVDSVKKGLDVNDLLANLYQQRDPKKGSVPDTNGSNSVDKTNKNGTISDLHMSIVNLGVTEPNLNTPAPDSSLNIVNTNTIHPNANGKNELKTNTEQLILDWDPLNLNAAALNSNQNGTSEVVKGVDEDDDDDDEWEFKDAQPRIPTGNEISKMSQIETENGPVSDLNGFNTNWNPSTLDFSGWNLNLNIVNSTTNSINVGPIHENSEVDEEGWKFKGADLKLQVGDDKWKFQDSQTKTEHMTTLNLNWAGSGWDPFCSDSSGFSSSEVKLDEKRFIANLIDEKKDSRSANGWVFNGAGQKFQIGYENSLIKSENGPALSSNGTDSSWNTLTLDGNANSNLNGMNLDKKQANLDLFDEYGDDNNGWEFNTAESASRPQDGNTKESGITADNHKGALPLSIFGDEEKEADDPVIYQDISTQASTSDRRDGIKGSCSNISINDLISSLYSQAQQNTSVNHKKNLSESGLDSTKTMMVRYLANHDFGDDSWEFQDASIGPSAEDRTSILGLGESVTKHEQSLSGNGLDPTKTIMASSLANGNHDFDDDSWEFQDASTGSRAEDQTSVLGLGEPLTKHNTQTELNDFVEFFSKLKEELHYVLLFHLENLKKARSAVALTGEDVKVQALDKEIQDLNDELHQNSIISSEVHSENHPTGNVHLNVFVEVLQEPKFHIFESECQLTEKLSLAETDLGSAIGIFKYVDFTLKILTLVRREDQFSYISVWSKMLAVCAQELRHGALIWKQSLQENVHGQILFKPQGKKYVLALGEIYRIVEVLGSSARLYKPWILASSTNPMFIYTLLSECSSLWLNSGLEEALQSILSSADFEYDGSLKTLPESIKYIHELDVDTLYNHVFSGQGPICQLSALTADTVPGMKPVIWNGEYCFLTLANLWANLVSSDPPNLPCIHVG
ncbi:uncharacterized protein LOC105647554 isoform X2 [Jatropha curcas]|uniref:uncharacterized protein LOC105647554 isoform X2 n=1 Tax=Jatropha curcas TaxID=180498 RepID=UPI0009D6746D|nr:uncharacterized protein LOC105647554 isoform X2 [Jatropha curcas]